MGSKSPGPDCMPCGTGISHELHGCPHHHHHHPQALENSWDTVYLCTIYDIPIHERKNGDSPSSWSGPSDLPTFPLEIWNMLESYHSKNFHLRNPNRPWKTRIIPSSLDSWPLSTIFVPWLTFLNHHEPLLAIISVTTTNRYQPLSTCIDRCGTKHTTVRCQTLSPHLGSSRRPGNSLGWWDHFLVMKISMCSPLTI